MLLFPKSNYYCCNSNNNEIENYWKTLYFIAHTDEKNVSDVNRYTVYWNFCDNNLITDNTNYIIIPINVNHLKSQNYVANITVNFEDIIINNKIISSPTIKTFTYESKITNNNNKVNNNKVNNNIVNKNHSKNHDNKNFNLYFSDENCHFVTYEIIDFDIFANSEIICQTAISFE